MVNQILRWESQNMYESNLLDYSMMNEYPEKKKKNVKYKSYVFSHRLKFIMKNESSHSIFTTFSNLEIQDKLSTLALLGRI